MTGALGEEGALAGAYGLAGSEAPAEVCQMDLSATAAVRVDGNRGQPPAVLRRRRRSAGGQAAECVNFQNFWKVVARPDGLAPRLRLVRPSWRRERWAYPAPPSAP